MGLWGSQDILMAFEAGDPGSNPGRPALTLIPYGIVYLYLRKNKVVFRATFYNSCSGKSESEI